MQRTAEVPDGDTADPAPTHPDLLALIEGGSAELRPLDPERATAALHALDGAEGEPLAPRYALGLFDGRGEVVAVAALSDSTTPRTARVAVVVRRDWRRAGVGRLLLRKLADEGTRQELEWLVATFSAHDEAAAHLVATSGLPTARRVVGGVATVALRVANASP